MLVARLGSSVTYQEQERVPQEDVQLEADLKQDPKEIAEHIMLVDLGRNDVSRVCEAGSVRLVRNQA